MIYEVYKNSTTDEDKFVGFEVICNGIIIKFQEIVERAMPDFGLIIEVFFDVNTSIGNDWLYISEDSLINFINSKTGEKITIKNPDIIGVIIIAAALRESRCSYYSGNIDLAWRMLVNISCRLRDLNILFDKFDNIEMPANEIILLRSVLSAAGIKGSDATHNKTRKLKKWAVENSRNMHGSDREISRELAEKLPAELKNASNDPARLIYDALRANRKSLS